MYNKETGSFRPVPWLRLLGGGYLVYLAWDLRTAVQDSPVFLLAVLVFGLAGIAVLGYTLLAMRRESRSGNDEIPGCAEEKPGEMHPDD